MVTYHLLIKGKVQGVFYRETAKRKALELGLTGWVKNKPDGDVEALVSGDEHKIEEFIAWSKEGPPLAKVKDVTATRTETVDFKSFTVER